MGSKSIVGIESPVIGPSVLTYEGAELEAVYPLTPQIQVGFSAIKPSLHIIQKMVESFRELSSLIFFSDFGVFDIKRVRLNGQNDFACEKSLFPGLVWKLFAYISKLYNLEYSN